MKIVVCFFTFLTILCLFEKQAYASIILSEFLPNPEGSDEEGEWIELYNDGDNEVSLEGYSLSDAFGATSSYTFTQNDGSFYKMLGKSYLVLPRNITHITLNNDTEQIALKNYLGMMAPSEIFSPVKEGYSFSYIDGRWFVSIPTPGNLNKEKEDIETSPSPSPETTLSSTPNIVQPSVAPTQSPIAKSTPLSITKTPKPIIESSSKKVSSLISENENMKKSTQASTIANDVKPLLPTKEIDEFIENRHSIENKNNSSVDISSLCVLILGIVLQILSCLFLFLKWYNENYEKRDKNAIVSISSCCSLDDHDISTIISK